MTDSQKLDQLLSLMSEEVNIHPDTLRPGSYTQLGLHLTYNSSLPMYAFYEVVDRIDGRYLMLQIRDPLGTPVISKQWKAVYREPFTDIVIDRPNTDEQFNVRR